MKQAQFSDRVDAYRRRVERVIDDFLAGRFDGGAAGHNRLAAAIRYATTTRGKRIRALLSYATAETLALPSDVADYPAAAVELLHTYSLVHDDLPAMDNDDLRRGQPTVHRKFDETTAILVGDALLTYSFELLADADVDPELRVQWVARLARAGGAQGMINGQAIDLEGETRRLTLEELECMHRQKSGALIEASINMVSDAGDPEPRNYLTGFGHHMGLAFQIRDDILDVEGSTEELGKPQGSDSENNKSTFVSLLGLEGARARMREELEAARERLHALEQNTKQRAGGLHWVADYIINRAY